MPDVSQNHQIVLAAFGSSMNSAVYETLQRRFEAKFGQKIPLGFTSRIGNPKLKCVLEGLSLKERKEIVIVPLFMLTGKVVLENIKNLAEELKPHFKSIKVAKPLLPDERIYQVVREELLSELEKLEHEKTGILFVGHGTPDKESSLIYKDFLQKIKYIFPPSVRVAFGNVEFSAPYCKDILGELIMSDIKTLLIQPFMIVDGVHIHKEIKGALSGELKDSKLYQYLLNTYGEAIKPRVREIAFVYKPGLGAYQGVFELFANHTLKSIKMGESI